MGSLKQSCLWLIYLYLSSNLGEKSLFGWTCHTPVRNNGLVDVVARCLPISFPFAFSSRISWKRLLSGVRRPPCPSCGTTADGVEKDEGAQLALHETFRFPRLVCRFHGRLPLLDTPALSCGRLHLLDTPALPLWEASCWTPLPLPCFLLEKIVNGVEWRTACHCIRGW